MQTKGLFLIILVLFFSLKSFGQQEELFSNYMVNPSTLNPAYSGTREINTLYLQYRNQWLGIDGAPKTTYLNYQTYGTESHLGFGVNFISDKIGLLDNNKFTVDWSYILRVTDKTKFSVGIRNGFKSLSFALNKLNVYQIDPTLVDLGKSNFTYELGIGMFMYNDRSYLGFSVPNINNSYTIKNANTGFIYRNVSHFYLMGGKLIDVGENVVLKPSFLLRNIPSSKTQVDISMNALFKQKYQIGGTYRTSTAYNIMAGFQYSPQVFVGYSYDSETTMLGNYTKGSHEIYIRYEFGNKNFNVPSPRFF